MYINITYESLLYVIICIQYILIFIYTLFIQITQRGGRVNESFPWGDSPYLITEQPRRMNVINTIYKFHL